MNLLVAALEHAEVLLSVCLCVVPITDPEHAVKSAHWLLLVINVP